jgi:hypothetical protein
MSYDGPFYPPDDSKFDRASSWPGKDEPGQFLVRCSCEKWAVIGTSKEITDAARRHDDSPFRSHVVTIYGRLLETT